MKTHSGAKKRFRATANGKIKRGCKGRRHILTKKTTERKRRLRKGDYIPEQFEKKIKRLIGE